MEAQLEQTGQFGRKLSITIPATEVDKAFDEVTRQVGKDANVPGFRAGKIPRGVLEQHYGQQIKSEVRERLVEESLMAAMQEKQVSPIASPRLHVNALERGAVFSYTAEFEVPPEIALKTYKGLKVAKLAVAVTDAEIDAQLETMRTQAAQLVPVLIRDTVEQGDVVLVDYEGTMGGVPFAGGKAENALIEVGGRGYLPQFSEGLLGARVPGERIVQVDFPSDYGAKELAGKPASFRLRLREIKKKELPALDDEFARDVGEESLAALREKVKQSALAQKTHDVEAEQRHKLLQALALANPFDVPQSMIEEQTVRMVESAQARLQQMMGRRIELSAAEQQNLRETNKESAELHVKSGLLLFEIARVENLTVDNSEIDAEVETIVKGFTEEAPRVQSYYRDPDNRERLRYRLLEEKVLALLFKHAELTSEPDTAAAGPAASASAPQPPTAGA